TLASGGAAPSLRASRPTRPGLSQEGCEERQMAYILNTTDDEREMLAAIGLGSLDALFDMIPPEFRLERPLAIPPALTELELTRHMSDLAARNRGADARPCFLGGGCYDHFVPAVVD